MQTYFFFSHRVFTFLLFVPFLIKKQQLIVSIILGMGMNGSSLTNVSYYVSFKASFNKPSVVLATFLWVENHKRLLPPWVRREGVSFRNVSSS